MATEALPVVIFLPGFKGSLLAHSMGVLVVSYYLRCVSQPLATARETWEGASQVDSVVMAGAPFRGFMGAFRDMVMGRVTGLNT